MENNTTPFTKPGECSDEIVFLFDNEKKLFVSQNFLSYVSPVFKAMFEHDFKEKESRSVTMTGKKYEDVLGFLLCVHPNVQKAVNNNNVLSIAHIAEEYQAKLIITKCQHVMLEWLKSELASAQEAKEICQDYQKAIQARNCLRILTKADSLHYQAIVQEACKIIGHFGHAIFTGTVQKPLAVAPVMTPRGPIFVKSANTDPIESCKMLFDNLPMEIKYKLLLERLQIRDNVDMHVDINDSPTVLNRACLKYNRK